MSDYRALAERLRSYAKDQGGWHNIDDTCEEAASAILALLEEIDHGVKFRAAVEAYRAAKDRADLAEARLAKAKEALRAIAEQGTNSYADMWCGDLARNVISELEQSE